MKTIQIIPPGSGIYIITCSGNNKFYIGSTENFMKRYEKHSRDCNNYSFEVNAMNEDAEKYGRDSFKFDVLTLCNNKVLTIVENHYIKLYNAKLNGYNSNYAPVNIKTKSKYKYVAKNNYGQSILDKNRLLDEYIMKVLDLKSNRKIYVTLYELYKIFNELVLSGEDLNPILNIITKLDYNCYIISENLNDGIIYKFSGKEINYLINGGMHFSSFKKLPYDFRRALARNINTKKIFIEIDNINENLSVDYLANEKFLSAHEMIDLRYNPYNIDINKY